MNTLNLLNEALVNAQNGMDSLAGVLDAEWQVKAGNVKNASAALNNSNGRLIEQVQQVVIWFSMLAGKANVTVGPMVSQLELLIQSTDAIAHQVSGDAAQLSVALQPLIGHLNLAKRQFAQQVAEAEAAKVEADFQVKKLQYAIDNAGKYVSPYFRQGEPHTRQLVKFSTDTAAVTKRLAEMIALQIKATAMTVSLNVHLSLLNATNISLDNLLGTEELLNSFRTTITQLDGDLEAARTKEHLILSTGSETLSAFYTRQLSSAIAEMQRLLG